MLVGGAGTTKLAHFGSGSGVWEECTVKGKRGGAVVRLASVSVGVDGVVVVILLLIIFSSIKARTLTEAVCNGVSVPSFFSHVLFLSES